MKDSRFNRGLGRRSFLRALMALPGVASYGLQGGLASASDDTARIIDAGNASKGIPERLRFSPDGQWLAMTTRKSITLYDAQTLDEQWSQTSDFARGVAFSPDSTTATFLVDDGIVRVVRTSDGSQLWEVRRPGRNIYFGGRAPLVYSHDGSMIASANDVGEVYLWKVGDQGNFSLVGELDDGIVFILFSNDDSSLIAMDGGRIAGDNNWPAHTETLGTWRITDSNLLSKVEAPLYLHPWTLFAEGRLLIAIDDHGGNLSYDLAIWEASAMGIAVKQDLATRAFDMTSSTMLGSTAYDRINTLSNDESLFAVSLVVPPYIELWNLTTGVQIPLLFEMPGRPIAIACSPESNAVAASFEDGTIRFWPIMPT